MDYKARHTFLKRFSENKDRIEKLENKMKIKGTLSPNEAVRLHKYKSLDKEMGWFL